MKIVCLVILAVIAISQTVNAEDEEKPKCYECSDNKQQREAKGLPKCSSDKSKWKTCEATQCWNTTTEIPLSDPEIERGCGSKGGGKIGACVDAKLFEVCLCKGNLCNGGNGAYQIEASIVGIMTLVTLLQCFFL